LREDLKEKIEVSFFLVVGGGWKDIIFLKKRTKI